MQERRALGQGRELLRRLRGDDDEPGGQPNTDGHEPQDVSSPCRRQEELHRPRHCEREADAGEGKRGREKSGRERHPAWILHRKQGAEAQGDRGEPGHLKRPQQVLPPGTKDQQQQGRRQCDEISGAESDQLEEQYDVGGMSHHERRHIRQVGAQPDRVEQR